MKQTRASIITAILMLTCVAIAVSGCTAPGQGAGTADSPTDTPAANPVSLSKSIQVYGNVSDPLNISIGELGEYPQIAIKDHAYGAHHNTYTMSATGASLNAILDEARPNGEAQLVIFTGSDGFSSSVPLSDIRADNQSMIVASWSTTDTSSQAGSPDSLRDIIPSQYYAQSWVFDLASIQVQ